MIERYILKELGFSLYNIIDNHPHKYILYFIKLLNGSEALASCSWKYLNDCMRLDISLRFEAPIIACAAIYLASHQIGFVLPEREEEDDDYDNLVVYHGGHKADGTNCDIPPDASDKGDSNSATVSWWEIMGTNKREILTICEQILGLYVIEKV